jgi:hypothetical protein
VSSAGDTIVEYCDHHWHHDLIAWAYAVVLIRPEAFVDMLKHEVKICVGTEGEVSAIGFVYLMETMMGGGAGTILR